MARNLSANAGDAGLIPDRGTRIRHAVGQLSSRTAMKRQINKFFLKIDFRWIECNYPHPQAKEKDSPHASCPTCLPQGHPGSAWGTQVTPSIILESFSCHYLHGSLSPVSGSLWSSELADCRVIFSQGLIDVRLSRVSPGNLRHPALASYLSGVPFNATSPFSPPPNLSFSQNAQWIEGVWKTHLTKWVGIECSLSLN